MWTDFLAGGGAPKNDDFVALPLHQYYLSPWVWRGCGGEGCAVDTGDERAAPG